ncbi:MAG: hypothetical protein WEA77_14300 [Hyphomonas sp.]|uniref:hypothetical protein n=1 Tax=Hyphomonas sp. TaxID=87 RepID=UPI0034A0212C
MKRQTIDQEGARQGEVSSASLQLADDTIAIRRIATMSVERHEFFPWDTPANRKTQSMYATFCVGMLFFGLVGFAWWAIRQAQGDGVIALLAGIVLMVLGFVLGIRAAMIAMKLKKQEPYFRLLIGTSDGRQIPLVDNNRDVLIKIRDVVRHKMDTGDAGVTGDFDLNLDIVNLRLPKGVAASVPLSRPIEADVFDDEEGASPPGYPAAGKA